MNIQNEIQIGIALSKNSDRYLRFLIESIKLTTDHYRFKFLLGINGIDESLIRQVVNEENVRYEIFDATVSAGYSSLNHGLCLDIIFSRMTSKYGMLVDCDIAFLSREWDQMMLATLNDTNVIVGAEYDGEKYKGFPNVICAMFDVDVIRALGISFKPEGSISLSTDTFETYGYPVDSEPTRIILDTGSELPRKVKAASMSGTPMPIFRSCDDRARFMSDEIRGEEYQLYGIPLVTHLGRSYTREFGVNTDAIAWEQKVRERLHAL